MKIVTTVHKAGFDRYGMEWVESIDNWPASAEWWMYTEGFDFSHPRIKTKRVESIARLENFKTAHSHYKPVSWEWDVVKWSNKAFTINDAFTDYRGLAIWLDCDCQTYNKFPEGYVESLLPEGYYISLFKRRGMPPETGFWLMDTNHRYHQKFMSTWIQWWETNSYRDLTQWCDAATMEATIRMYERQNLIKTHTLSEEFELEQHPMSRCTIAKYIDHKKGHRKAFEVSPENVYRKDDNRKRKQGASALRTASPSSTRETAESDS